MKKTIKKLKKKMTGKNLLAAAIIVVAAAGLMALGWKVFKPAPKKNYKVAVVVRSQYNPDKSEDLKTSLKKGDVLLVTDESHKFSRSEKISYLILTMRLSEEQAQKLTQPEERELDEDELSEGQKAELEQAEDEDRLRDQFTETMRARLYYIDLEEDEFEGFQALDLLNGQPYKDVVFDWGIVEKKRSVEKELGQ